MYKADYSIKLLTIAGVHRPRKWSSVTTKILYSIFTACMISHIYFFNVSLCMYLVLYTLNELDEFAESLCWFLAAFVACIKMTNFLLRGNDIIRLLNFLNEDGLKIRDSTEKMMQDKCDLLARRNTKYFFIITSATVFAMICSGLAKGKDNLSLPIKASFPYHYNKKLVFSLTYFSQSVCLYSACLINVGSETFVMTMLIQICSQLDIICHRLENLSHFHLNNKSTIYDTRKEAKIIKECVIHHNSIYRFSGKLNNIFNIVFGIQFLCSVLNICTILFSLSTKNEFNDKVVVQLIALINFLFQIFLYCHFGNAVMLKSLKVANVFGMMNWTLLKRSTIQGFFLISMRARLPIILTIGSVVPMILRTFYVAYNLMKTINA